MRCFPGFVNRAVVQLFSALTLSVKYGRKRGGMFWKSYSDEGNRSYMLRSGIWEESKNPKSCLRAKRRAGQLAYAQTIPAHRLTTPLCLLRSSDRFLQSHISRLSPFPESVLQPSAPLPAHSLTEVLLPKWAENAVMAWLRAFRLQKPSGRACCL